MNPLKLNAQIVIPDVSNIHPTSPSNATKYRGAGGGGARYSKTSGPLKMGPDLIKLFDQTSQQLEKEKATGIENGTLDRFGNPIGTKYWDTADGAPQVRRPRVVDRSKKRIKIVLGMLFGELRIIRRLPKIKAVRANLAERYRCECSCGKQVVVPRYYLLRPQNPKTHCGCKTATLKSQNPREYRIYMMIHQRCYNPKHNSYAHYKERGITLYEPWNNSHKDGFKLFLEHVGKSPDQWHSLDRVHNSKGYEPGNLRWATATEQRANQGDRIGGYTPEEIADMGYTEEEFIEKIISGEIQ